MILSEVKLLFDTGDLEDCECLKVPTVGTYYLLFNHRDGTKILLTTNIVREKLEEFKTLTEVIDVVKTIGFKVVKIKPLSAQTTFDRVLTE